MAEDLLAGDLTTAFFPFLPLFATVGVSVTGLLDRVYGGESGSSSDSDSSSVTTEIDAWESIDGETEVLLSDAIEIGEMAEAMGVIGTDGWSLGPNSSLAFE